MTAYAWFHVLADSTRAGPVSGDDLVRLFQAGRIHAATPVWREGMTDWAPLSTVGASLGLAPMPPPLPAGPRAAVPPRRSGLHWVWVLLIMLAVITVPVIGIIAAIVLPAYQDYRVRSGINEIAAISAPLRMGLQSVQAGDVDCATAADPRDADADPLVHGVLPMLREHRHVADVVVDGEDVSAGCRIEITLRGFDRDPIDGQSLTWRLAPDDGGWTCSSTVPARYLPAACR